MTNSSLRCYSCEVDKDGAVQFCDYHQQVITRNVHPASLTDAIEVVKRLRDEWDKSDDPAYITVIKMRAATEIITTLASLEGKAPEPFDRTPFDQSLNRILNAVKDDSEVWGIQAVAIKHVFHDAIDAALRTEGKAPVGEHLDTCAKSTAWYPDESTCTCRAVTTPSSGEEE